MDMQAVTVEVSKLSLMPRDIVVLRYSHCWPKARIKLLGAIAQKLKLSAPHGVRIAILPDDVDLTVVRAADAVEDMPKHVMGPLGHL